MDKTLTEQEIALLRRNFDLLLRTGQLLVESAADTNRVVRNLNRVAASVGLPGRKAPHRRKLYHAGGECERQVIRSPNSRNVKSMAST